MSEAELIRLERAAERVLDTVQLAGALAQKFHHVKYSVDDDLTLLARGTLELVRAERKRSRCATTN